MEIYKKINTELVTKVQELKITNANYLKENVNLRLQLLKSHEENVKLKAKIENLFRNVRSLLDNAEEIFDDKIIDSCDRQQRRSSSYISVELQNSNAVLNARRSITTSPKKQSNLLTSSVSVLLVSDVIDVIPEEETSNGEYVDSMEVSHDCCNSPKITIRRKMHNPIQESSSQLPHFTDNDNEKLLLVDDLNLEKENNSMTNSRNSIKDITFNNVQSSTPRTSCALQDIQNSQKLSDSSNNSTLTLRNRPTINYREPSLMVKMRNESSKTRKNHKKKKK